MIRINTIKGGKMPQRQTKQSIGYDCFIREKEEKNGQLICKLCFTLELDSNVAALLIPRSSIYTTGLRLSNCIGLGDPDYQGEYMAIFDIVEGSSYEVGDRCCQLMFVSALFADNDNYLNQERTGGHGSTGNKSI